MSKPRTLHRRQFVARPLRKVFRFFEKPENLALITPPSLRFRLLTPSPVTMTEGCVIDYRIRLFGLPLRWRSLISSYEPPYFFVDEQLEGPYRYWRHEHQFESADGGTWFVDHVYYRLPPLPSAIERIVHGAYVGPYLKQIYDYRASFYRRFSDPAVAWRPHRLTNEEN